MVGRYTVAPPIDRLKPLQIIEEVNRCNQEAREALTSIGKTTSYEVLSQSEALNAWFGKFIVMVQLQFEKDEKARAKLATDATTWLSRARQFFIADHYPADFVDVTLALARLRLNCGDAAQAMKVTIECLRALRPTSIAIRQRNVSPQALESQAKSREAIGTVKKDVLEVTRSILKELMRLRLVSRAKFDVEKRLYQMATDCTPENVVDLLLEVKRVLKL
jgi:hypothetical protein